MERMGADRGNSAWKDALEVWGMESRAPYRRGAKRGLADGRRESDLQTDTRPSDWREGGDEGAERQVGQGRCERVPCRRSRGGMS